MAEPAKSGGVQSVGRVLDLLEIVGDAGGEIGLSELAARSGLPLPSIHRLVRTLVQRGYMRQLSNRRYALGARLVPLGQVAGTMLGAWAQPVLTGLVDALGESREPRRPRPRRRDVHRAGALPAHDADVHRAGPPGPRALHRAWARHCCRSSPTTPCASCSPAPACRPQTPQHDHRSRRRCSPSWRASAATATPWTRASRRSACAASRCRCTGALGTLGISVSGTGPPDDPGADRPRHPPAPRGRRAAVVGDRRALDGLTVRAEARAPGDSRRRAARLPRARSRRRAEATARLARAATPDRPRRATRTASDALHLGMLIAR